ncbi:MAG: hypothetical protein IJF67_10280 [Clostridia bacterium]|nr:hypothetical protein [Clostridia bacterium]
MKKFTTIAILTAMLASLAACGGESAGSAGGDTTAAATDAPETTSRFVADDLPDDLDFGGETVTWYVGDYNNAYWDDMYAETENGSRVNDAVFHTRQAVEERLNVKLDFYRKQVGWNDRLDINKDITASVMAGDGAYDLYIGMNLLSMMLEDEYFLNLTESKYINFEKPWWNQSQFEMLPGNKVYVAVGDGTLSLIKHTFCIFFNQQRLDTLGISENMYELVHSGKWTLDKLGEYAKLGYHDANGNTTPDYGDTFGLTLGDQNKFIGWQFASGAQMVRMGKDGYELALGSEHVNDVFDKVFNLLLKTEGVLIPEGNNDNNTLAVAAGGGNYADKTFMEGNATFTASLVGDAGTILADVKFDYGILPYPKYDEAQENYVSAVQRFASFAIPAYGDVDMGGAILEAWSSEAYRTLQPEYFETTLKARYSADDEMAGIFDLLRETIRFDIGDYFSAQLNTISSHMKTMLIDKKEGQWMSEYTAKQGGWEESLVKIWETLS